MARSKFRLGNKIINTLNLGISDIFIYLGIGIVYPLRPIANAVITCTSATYNGNNQIAQTITVVFNGETLIEGTDYNVISNSGGINAGNYTVTVEGINRYEGTLNGTFTINKANITYTAPTAKSLTYNGSAQALLNAGSNNVGTMQYSNDESNWSTTIPTGTNANNYTSYWRIVGNNNYNDVVSESINTTIAKADQSAPVAQGFSVAYGNTATASASGGGSQGSIEWSNGNTLTGNAGSSKTTKARWSGNNNYNSSPYSNEVTLSIVKANQSAPTATGKTTTYPTTATATASGGGGQGSIQWSNGNTQTSTGSKSTQARWSGNNNYNASSWSNSVTLTMNKASQSAPTATGATVDYGSTAVASASGGGGQGSIQWSNGNTRTAVGSQTTKARWSGNSNYNASPYSNEVTLSVSDTHNGHKFVDLGLPSGTKWATMNVGASTITDYGNYYLWGYGDTVYSYGQVELDDPYGNRNLTDNEDTARKVWKGSWHMPTLAQIKELTHIDNTSKSVTTVNGVNMFKFTSKHNSNYVLFPFPGEYRHSDGILQNTDYTGNYWSRTPDGTSNAYILNVVRLSTTATYYSKPKNEGCSVRPVLG